MLEKLRQKWQKFNDCRYEVFVKKCNEMLIHPMVDYPFHVYMTFENPQIYKEKGYKAAVLAAMKWFEDFNRRMDESFERIEEMRNERDEEIGITNEWSEDRVKSLGSFGLYIPSHQGAMIRRDEDGDIERKYVKDGREIEEFEL